MSTARFSTRVLQGYQACCRHWQPKLASLVRQPSCWLTTRLSALAEAARTAALTDSLVHDVRSLAFDCPPAAIAQLTLQFPGRAQMVSNSLTIVVGNPQAGQLDPEPACHRRRAGPVTEFKHSVHLCQAVIANGWDSAVARAVWASIRARAYCVKWQTFHVVSPEQQPTVPVEACCTRLDLLLPDDRRTAP